MTDQPLRTRLDAFFNGPAARTLARSAPAALLAGGVGVTLGAVIALPAFASAGLGIVLGGIAVNLTSTLIGELLLAPDDQRRGELVQRGLAQGDRDVVTLAAAALAYAGPELALALPEAGRDELVAGLEQAMQQSGGSLTAIAPRYAAALRDPHADWAALQADLRQAITRVSQTMEASDEGVIAGGQQRAEQVAGPVEQVMRATKKGRIENSGQTVIGGAVSDARRCPNCGMAVPAGQRFCGSCGASVPGVS